MPYVHPSASCGTRAATPGARSRDQRRSRPPVDRRSQARRAQAPQVAREGRDRAPASGRERTLVAPDFLFPASVAPDHRIAGGRKWWLISKFESFGGRMRKLVISAALAAAALIIAGEAPAQTWPNRTITLVVPFPPAGGVDALARIVAEKLSIALKSSVVVENRAGGGGTVGTRGVAKAEPDGHTLMLAHTGTISINPSLYANAGYDPRKDFTPIGLIASMPVALVAHPSFPAKTVADVIAIARKDPGKLNFGTSAIGTGGYLTAEYFKSVAALDMVIVPYRGTGPLMNDLIGGHVPVSFGVLPPAIGNIQSGSLRAIAVTGTRRFSLLPDVPTASESGLPGFDAVFWNAP